MQLFSVGEIFIYKFGVCCNNIFCRENLLVLLFYVLFSDQTVQWKQYLQARSKNVDKTQQIMERKFDIQTTII